MSELDLDLFFARSKTASELRDKATECDRRADAAQRDGDAHDAAKWSLKARDFRRIAREKEFAA